MKKLILFLCIGFLSWNTVAQQEIGLTFNRQFDETKINWRYSDEPVRIQVLGLYYGQELNQYFSVRTALNWTQFRGVYNYSYFDCFACNIDYVYRGPRTYHQLEFELAGRFTVVRFWRLGWYVDLGFSMARLLNDFEEWPYPGSDFREEVLSHALAVSSGIRFRLSPSMSVDLQLQRRRYWQHNHWNGQDQKWFYLPGVAYSYQWD